MIEAFTVRRDETIYAAFLDVVLIQTGKPVCVSASAHMTPAAVWQQL